MKHPTLFSGLLACLLALTLSAAAGPPAARRILFLGDSITHAGEYVDVIDAALVQSGNDREVLNLGLSSETVSGLSEEGHAGGAFPRPDLHERLDRILAKVKPDLVVACYGMNCGIYLPFDEGRFAKYQDGIKRLREKVAAAGAGMIHLTPPVYDPSPQNAAVKYNEVLDKYSDWLVSQRAAGWQVLDLHSPMKAALEAGRAKDPAFKLAGDGVHPGSEGHRIMAAPVLAAWGLDGVVVKPEVLKLVRERQNLLKLAWLSETGHIRPGVPKGLPIAEAQAKAADITTKLHALVAGGAAPFPGEKSAWNGFDSYKVTVAGQPVTVVVPKEAAPGRPWVWHGEFFGHKPAPDIALLNKGWHAVYMQYPNQFGSPAAVEKWNALYAELTGKYSFGPKPGLVGLSRGGLYVYNWAIANPDKVGGIYADAAVCDFKSWPMGKGKGKGAPGEVANLLKAHGFADEAAALAWPNNPVDRLEPLAKAGVPLLHVYGDADDVVPWQENTGLVAERYKKLGGTITTIAKPGVNHHPHGLEDSSPIVNFFLGVAEKPAAPASKQTP